MEFDISGRSVEVKRFSWENENLHVELEMIPDPIGGKDCRLNKQWFNFVFKCNRNAPYQVHFEFLDSEETSCFPSCFNNYHVMYTYEASCSLTDKWEVSS